jgi:predicted metal-dependent phosphoesterase TrpH
VTDAAAGDDAGDVPSGPDARDVPSGWVQVDFHTHTYGSGDAVTTVEDFAAAVEAAGLDVVCVTDHNAVRVAHELVPLLDRDLGVRVIVGEEIKTHDGELIGLFLSERVSFGLPTAQAATAVRDQGGVTYVPHPIGPRSHAMAADDVTRLARAGLLDAVEVFNSRNPADSINAAAAALAVDLDLPGGVGSDAHYPEEIGAARLVMPDFDGPADMLVAMRAGRVVGRRHPEGRSSWRPRIIPAQSTVHP